MSYLEQFSPFLQEHLRALLAKACELDAGITEATLPRVLGVHLVRQVIRMGAEDTAIILRDSLKTYGDR